MLNESQAAQIAEKLFDLSIDIPLHGTEVQIDGQPCRMIKTGTNCRQLLFDSRRYRTQNTGSYKKSLPAQAARQAGLKIVWGLDSNPWECIINGELHTSDWRKVCNNAMSEGVATEHKLNVATDFI